MEITAIDTQEVASDANVLFTETPVKPTKCIMHRDGSGIITLRGMTNQCFARYLVTFSGNVAESTVVTPIRLALAIEGEALGSSTMIITSSVLGNFFNVATNAYIDVPKGCCLTVSVKNISGEEILVQNANLTAVRVA